jgi:hypothetical protein
MARARAEAQHLTATTKRVERAERKARKRQILRTVSGAVFATGVLLAGFGFMPAFAGALLAGVAAYLFEVRAGYDGHTA